ncbi:DUF2254 family protein [Cereibacter sphaeroides]|uniref:DUF2254 family protein n=1 Tax=Cereibacter sphaeroides TaxID=1063 RepID=UPI00399047A8
MGQSAHQLWFVSSVMIGLGALLALGAAAADRKITGAAGEVPWFVPVSAPAEARDLMSTPVTAMVPATSLIFSISMGVLTLAATQFGPRLVRNFMSMRQTQLTLGTFVMTIVYGLITLTLMAQTPAARPGPSPPSRLRWRAWGFSARSSTGSPGRSWRRQSSRGWVPS